MRYVTGVHALNLPCSLETCGDWHTSAMNWDHIQTAESEGSAFGDWGIEPLVPGPIRQLESEHYVADTLRALADLLLEGRYCCVQGAKDDFICNPKYHMDFFTHVASLSSQPNWNEIDNFMCKEFGKEWWTWMGGR